MHWTDLKVGGKHKITGRGDILILDLIINGFTKDDWVDEIQIKVGHTLNFEGDDYKIIGMESFANLMNGKHSHRLGLIVTQI